MSKQLLIETRLNSLSLCEGVQSKTKGCLGTLKGPCADYKNPTRNNNFYSRKLWENVFKNPLVKESLEDKVLIGELDHPGDRLETKATNACIVMTDYDFNDTDGVVNGTFDILDTPNGRILRSLLDYGCKIGVSSRGEGDVTESNGVNNVDEESYDFVAFDAVVLPAVQKAKPALQESVKRESLKESLASQVKEATTLSELTLIKKVVEATNLPDVDSLLESINNKSKELEGINGSSNLIEDLEKANQRIVVLEEENKSLKQEVTNSKSRVSRLVESRRRQFEKSDGLKSDLNDTNSKYKDTVFKLGLSKSKVESLEARNSELTEEISRKGTELSRVRKDLSSKIKSLEESLEASQNACRDKDKELGRLKKSADRLESDHKKEVGDLKSQLESLEKKLSAAKKREESMKKTFNSSMRQYVIERSKALGVDCSSLLESTSLSSVKDFKDLQRKIDEEVSRSDRYRKLPLADSSLSLRESKAGLVLQRDLSDEDEQTTNFMKTFYNKN